MGAHLFTHAVADSTLPHPGVRFPPPLLFVTAFAAGWLLHRRRPLALFPDEWATAREAVGVTLVAIGAALVLWALVTFRRHHTAIYPNQPAVRIVRDGPYRWTRNPMYVSLTVIYLGLGLFVNSAYPFLFLPLALVLLVRLVIAREERYLSSAFGEDYAAYCRDVRRWV